MAKKKVVLTADEMLEVIDFHEFLEKQGGFDTYEIKTTKHTVELKGVDLDA